MHVTKQIDWLAVTYPGMADGRQNFSTWVWRFVGRGHHGYASAYKDTRTGATMEQDSQAPDMSPHMVLSGAALEAVYAVYGHTPSSLVRKISDAQGRASRIDLAINIHGGTLTPKLLQDALREGVATMKAKDERLVSGAHGDIRGDTLYMGSPKSDVQVRFYDKNAERRIASPEAWMRLEMQLRRVKARAAFIQCVTYGIEATVTGHLSRFLDYDCYDLEMAFEGKSVEPLTIGRQDTSRQRWLLGQVASALAHETLENQDFRARFDAAVQSAVDEIKAKEKPE